MTTTATLCRHCRTAPSATEYGLCRMCLGEYTPGDAERTIFDARAVLLPSGAARVLVTCTDGRTYEWRLSA